MYSAVQMLRTLGINMQVMLTGDIDHVAAEIAGDIGLHEYYAGLLPEQKVDHVQALEGAGYVAALDQSLGEMACQRVKSN